MPPLNHPTNYPANYIDPGTAGAVFTSLGAVIAGFIALIGAFLTAYFIRPIKRLLTKLKKVLLGRERVSFKAFTLTVIIAVAVIALPMMLFSGVDGMKKEKVLVLGIDALDARVTEKLISEGELPNFARLKEDGGYSRLLSTIPPETPVAWTAAATGTNPGGHGIYDFVGRDPKTYLPKLKLNEMKPGLFGPKYESAIKGTPFWRITSDNGIKTTVIKWPVTFPPEKVNGNMLSGLGVVDLRGFLNSYSFYTSVDVPKKDDDVGRVVNVIVENDEIANSVYGPVVSSGGEETESHVPMKIKLHEGSADITLDGSTHRVNVNSWSEWMEVEFMLDALRKVKGIFRVYLLSVKPEFSMYMTTVQIHPKDHVFDISYPKGYAGELADEIGLYHTLGMAEDTKAVTEGRISRSVFLEQVNGLEEEREKMFWYEFDRFESGVLAFGFDSGDRMFHIFFNGTEDIPKAVTDYYKEKDRLVGRILSKIDDDTKVIIFSDHGFSTFERAVNINTWLVENGYMTLTREVSGEDYGELFRYVDWSKTKAYALGFSSIYINLEGREGKGIVPETGKDELIREIQQKLRDLKDPETGKSVITDVYIGSEVYSGPFKDEAPDVVIGFNEGYRMSWQSAVGGVTQWLMKDNEEKWIGDHLIDRSHVPAVLFANFNIPEGMNNITDIAPTVLSLLKVDIPETMDGKSLVS